MFGFGCFFSNEIILRIVEGKKATPLFEYLSSFYNEIVIRTVIEHETQFCPFLMRIK